MVEGGAIADGDVVDLVGWVCPTTCALSLKSTPALPRWERECVDGGGEEVNLPHVFDVILQKAHAHQGLNISTPVSSKSATFRVTTVIP